MKLSEMNTDQMAEALCAMGDHVNNICMDTEFNDQIKKLSDDMNAGGMTVYQKLGRTVSLWLPALLVTHKAEVYAILSVLTGKSVEEIAAQNGMQTIKDARESFDGELKSFFSLFVSMG